MTAMMLQSLGYAVIAAATPGEAIRWDTEQQFGRPEVDPQARDVHDGGLAVRGR